MFLNPYEMETVSRNQLISFLCSIIPFLTKYKDAEVSNFLATTILESWEQNGIAIKSLAELATTGENRDSDPNIIREEKDTKAMKIFQEFQNKGKIEARDFAGLNDVQIVNKFLSQHENAMKVR